MLSEYPGGTLLVWRDARLAELREFLKADARVGVKGVLTAVRMVDSLVERLIEQLEEL